MSGKQRRQNKREREENEIGQTKGKSRERIGKRFFMQIINPAMMETPRHQKQKLQAIGI